MKVNFYIPNRSIGFFFGFIAAVVFTYAQWTGYLLPGFREIFSLEPNQLDLHHIGLMWIPVINYLLVSGNLALAALIFKDRLKPFDEKGLIYHIVYLGHVSLILLLSISVIVISLGVDGRGSCIGGINSGAIISLGFMFATEFIKKVDKGG